VSESECVTGRPCRLQCSLFCALEESAHRGRAGARIVFALVLATGITLGAAVPAFAAELRLPADLSDEEREQAIMNHAILTGIYLDDDEDDS
jgi:hypothetical protein